MSARSSSVGYVETANLHLPALLLLGGALNGFVVRILEAVQLEAGISLFLGISPFELIAVAVAAHLYFENKTTTEHAPGLPEFLFIAVLLVPSSTASWIATALYGLYHAARVHNEERTAFFIMIALAACSIWSSLVMKWIAVPVTTAEASLVWHALSFLRDDISLSGNIIGIPDGHRIVLLIACTTAYGLPKAFLGFTAISLFMGLSSRKHLFTGLVATLILYAVANLIRLCAMTWSDPAFHLAHGPVGANIFDAITTAGVFLLAFWAAGRQS